MKPAVALAALLLLPLRATAADLSVSYLVEEKPLKTAIAGTALTFDVYEGDCATLVQSSVVNIENVTVLSKLKQMTPKNDTKLPNTVELRTTLNVPPGSSRALVVSGPGVVPVGGPCQAQGAPTVSVPVVKGADGSIVGTFFSDPSCGVAALIATPVGPFAVPVFSNTSFGQCNSSINFTSSDCSGTPLVRKPSNTPLVQEAPGVNGSIYFWTGAAPMVLVNSALQYTFGIGSCSGPGQTFVAPHGCCCGPGCMASFSDNFYTTAFVSTIPTPLSVSMP